MIKLVQCIHGRPGMPAQEFRKAWQRYGQVLDENRTALGIREIELTTTLAVQANVQIIVNRATAEPFQAMAEIWWENASVLEKALDTPEGRAAAARINTVQEEFMDLPRCVFFFAFQDEGTACD